MTTTQRRTMDEVFEVMTMEEYRKRVPFLQDIIREEELQKAQRRGQRRGLAEGRAEGRKRGLEHGLQRGLREGLRKGLRKGLAEGVQKGLAEGLRLGIVAQWAVRFGKPPGRTITARLARADVETLRSWTQRLVTARRPADVLA
ncbi:MAG: hypothetical protein SFW67_24225 [Myxococcaceae bacterium]|nr:hypothetical protein [Myxococcaceae bacterium]